MTVATDETPKVKNKIRWPIEASLRSKFLVPDCGEDGPSECLVTYDESSSRICVMSAPLKEERDGIERPTVILDSFDPHDVVGAELEIRFHDGIGDDVAEELSKRLNDDDGKSRGVGVHNEKSRIAQEASDREEEEDRKKREAGGKKATSADDVAVAVNPDKIAAAVGGAKEAPTKDAAEGGESAVACGEVLPTISNEMENLLFDECTGREGFAGSCATAFLKVYCYPRSPPRGWLDWCRGTAPSNESATAIEPSKLGHRRAMHRSLEVAPCEDFADARSIVRAIRRLAGLGHYPDIEATPPASSSSEKDRAGEDDKGTSGAPTNPTPAVSSVASFTQPRRFLVVVNPYSGVKRGEIHYKETVKPMLEQAGVEHDVCITTHAGHAVERMHQQKKSPNSNGGDNEDDDGIPRDVLEYDAVIAMGGDGILHELFQGVRVRSDSAEVYKNVKFGIIACGNGNGLAKSIVHACEEQFNVLEQMFLICRGHCNRIDLSEYETKSNKYTSFLTYSWGLIADCDLGSDALRWLGSARTDIYSVWRILNLKTYRAKFSYLPPEAVKDKTKEFVMPSLDEPVPKDWLTIEDEFVVFWASQVTHASHDMHISPLSQIQDGVFQILVIRAPCSKIKLVKMFLALEHAGHIEHEVVEFYECVAFRLEKLTEGSYNDVDGEEVENGPIQAHVVPKAVQFFTGIME